MQKYIQKGVGNRQRAGLVLALVAEYNNECGVAAWVRPNHSLRGLEDAKIRGTGCSSEIDATTLWIVGSREVE
jgi:hypothetical protein